jgi:hypothetical protein
VNLLGDLQREIREEEEVKVPLLKQADQPHALEESKQSSVPNSQLLTTEETRNSTL